jgi:osmotically-inducible protein OsmY
LNFRKEDPLAENNQNPGRKWRQLEKDGDGDKYFDNYRYTPYTTDSEFFRDPNIYEAAEVPRVTQSQHEKERLENDPRPRGDRRPDERIKDEIQHLLARHEQVDARDIQVDVREGMVTLSGDVGSLQEKRIAERITSLAFGVTEIKNNLNIKGQES